MRDSHYVANPSITITAPVAVLLVAIESVTVTLDWRMAKGAIRI